jgi:hypothetical protein
MEVPEGVSNNEPISSPTANYPFEGLSIDEIEEITLARGKELYDEWSANDNTGQTALRESWEDENALLFHLYQNCVALSRPRPFLATYQEWLYRNGYERASLDNNGQPLSN